MFNHSVPTVPSVRAFPLLTIHQIRPSWTVGPEQSQDLKSKRIIARGHEGVSTIDKGSASGFWSSQPGPGGLNVNLGSSNQNESSNAILFKMVTSTNIVRNMQPLRDHRAHRASLSSLVIRQAQSDLGRYDESRIRNPK